MRDKDLINELKTLKNIHPDKDWVLLTRATLMDTNVKTDRRGYALANLFNFAIPRPVAVSVIGLIVVVTVTASLAQRGADSDFASVSRYQGVSDETVQELKDVAESVFGGEKTDYTVVFNKDSEKRESFKDALRSRIESRIGFYNDLLAQLEDEDLAREISLNPRREELNFKLAEGDMAEQVGELLADAQEALDGGNLIDALDLVTAIDRILK